MARVWGWQRATGGLDAGPWSGGVRGGRGVLGRSLRCVGAGGPWSSLGAQNRESSEGAGPGAGRAVREGLDLGLRWDSCWALEIVVHHAEVREQRACRAVLQLLPSTWESENSHRRPAKPSAFVCVLRKLDLGGRGALAMGL